MHTRMHHCTHNINFALHCVSPNIIFIYLYILYQMIIHNEFETIKKLQNGYSITRFGDGEFRIIYGKNIPFQECNNELAEKLNKILRYDKLPDNLLVAIPPFYQNIVPKRINNGKVLKYWNSYLKKKESLHIESILNKNKEYYSSFISRIESFDYNKIDYMNEMSKIWKNRNVVLVINENLFNKKKILFDNIMKESKIKNIIFCPEINAYSEYNAIFNKCILNETDTLFLIMAGPMASVLSCELCKHNFQSIDIGHFFDLYDN